MIFLILSLLLFLLLSETPWKRKSITPITLRTPWKNRIYYLEKTSLTQCFWRGEDEKGGLFLIYNEKSKKLGRGGNLFDIQMIQVWPPGILVCGTCSMAQVTQREIEFLKYL